MQTASITAEPQRLRALGRANEVRLARAEIKRGIAENEVSAAEIILGCPWEVRTWPIADLLMCQRRWGISKCRKFLGQIEISEVKPLGKLTERQRRLLAQELGGNGFLAATQVAQRPALVLV